MIKMIRFIIRYDNKFITIDEDCPNFKAFDRKVGAKSYEIVGTEFPYKERFLTQNNDTGSKKRSNGENEQRQADEIIDQINNTQDFPIIPAEGEISLLVLHQKCQRLLRKAGLKTFTDIQNFTEEEIINVYGIGLLTYWRIILEMKRYGYNFKPGAIHFPKTHGALNEVKRKLKIR